VPSHAWLTCGLTPIGAVQGRRRRLLRDKPPDKPSIRPIANDGAYMARNSRRATSGPQAERHAAELATRLGKGLRDARRQQGLTQAEAARRAGISQPTWSLLETDRDPRYTLATWDRAAHAVGARLSAYVEG